MNTRKIIPFERPPLAYVAWLAGFWEGEGAINFDCGWRLSLAQNERKVLDEIAAKTDGKIYFQAASNSYRVYWYGKRALAVLEMIIPHLRSDYRKAQIERFRQKEIAAYCHKKAARKETEAEASHNRRKLKGRLSSRPETAPTCKGSS